MTKPCPCPPTSCAVWKASPVAGPLSNDTWHLPWRWLCGEVEHLPSWEMSRCQVQPASPELALPLVTFPEPILMIFFMEKAKPLEIRMWL